jgi:hypothetical protein
MAGRLGTPEIQHVLGRVSAAYEQGLPFGQAVRACLALRECQRRIVEEGGKASVRMLLPIALLILSPVRGGAGTRGGRADAARWLKTQR